jgi:hypothetical protein
MKSYVAEALIVIGGLLLLAPFYSRERANDRIAEFYSRPGNGSAVVLPDALQPHTGMYEWGGLIIGIGTIATGIGIGMRELNRP